jgi:hypothetical protein
LTLALAIAIALALALALARIHKPTAASRAQRSCAIALSPKALARSALATGSTPNVHFYARFL